MSAHSRKKLHNDEDTQDFTVGAKASRQQIAKRAVPEEGLSVSPDELGTRFLSDATEQSNFEGELVPELSLSGGASSDAALPNGDDSDGTLWDQTIRRAPHSDVREIRDVAIRDDDQRGVDPDSPDDQSSDHAPRTRVGTIDVHRARTVEASLFDDEDESGEIRAPDVNADDQNRRR